MHQQRHLMGFELSAMQLKVMFPTLLQLKKSIRCVCSPHISLSEAAKLLFTFINLKLQEGASIPGRIISKEIREDCSPASSPRSWQVFTPTELINRHRSKDLLRMGLPTGRVKARSGASPSPCDKMNFRYQRQIFSTGGSPSTQPMASIQNPQKRQSPSCTLC